MAKKKPTDEELFHRCVKFDTMISREMAERVVPFEVGFGLIDTRVPLVFAANLLIVTTPGFLDPEAVAGRADDLIGGAGMEHRTILTQDLAEGERLKPGLEELGYESDAVLYMALRREPDREPEVEVREVQLAEIEDLLLALPMEEDDVETKDKAAQILEVQRERGRYAGDRWFVAPAEGQPKSACCLLARGTVGQVEDVGTLEPARNKGLARAVMGAAIAASKEEKHELTFIAAYTDDWPRELYEKVGFDPVGQIYEFERKPGSN